MEAIFKPHLSSSHPYSFHAFSNLFSSLPLSFIFPFLLRVSLLFGFFSVHAWLERSHKSKMKLVFCISSCVNVSETFSLLICMTVTFYSEAEKPPVLILLSEPLQGWKDGLCQQRHLWWETVSGSHCSDLLSSQMTARFLASSNCLISVSFFIRW